MRRHTWFILLLMVMIAGPVGCGSSEPGIAVVTFPASAVGKEAEILRRQLRRFEEQHPDIRVELRPTPDASDQRHQLYVQWLNAKASDPDILQLDVVWTAEFAAAEWIMPLDRFGPKRDDFFPATIRANEWKGQLFALPWFVDVGMLYYRTDLVDKPPRTFADLTRQARAGLQHPGIRYGFLWQGARYEGIVCVFQEILGGFGGEIMDGHGRVRVDSPQAVEALRWMRDSIYVEEIVPQAVLTWQEEQTRFGFQNGQAVFLRNWPYAYALMEEAGQSKVAGKFAVTLMPATEHGRPTATLGGSQLALNANTENPEAAYRVIDYLTRPEQMLERAEILGQFPARRSVYDDKALVKALAIPPEEVRKLIEQARPRPVTPVYSELSEILQIWLHSALTRQVEPEQALTNAAQEMRRLLDKVGLPPEE